MADASSTPNKPRRRWFQFSLRTLLIVVMLAASLLVAWRMYVEPMAFAQAAVIPAICLGVFSYGILFFPLVLFAVTGVPYCVARALLVTGESKAASESENDSRVAGEDDDAGLSWTE